MSSTNLSSRGQTNDKISVGRTLASFDLAAMRHALNLGEPSRLSWNWRVAPHPTEAIPCSARVFNPTQRFWVVCVPSWIEMHRGRLWAL